MIWNETVECMDREQLREIQSIRLKKMAEYVYHNTLITTRHSIVRNFKRWAWSLVISRILTIS